MVAKHGYTHTCLREDMDGIRNMLGLIEQAKSRMSLQRLSHNRHPMKVHLAKV